MEGWSGDADEEDGAADWRWWGEPRAGEGGTCADRGRVGVGARAGCWCFVGEASWLTDGNRDDDDDAVDAGGADELSLPASTSFSFSVPSPSSLSLSTSLVGCVDFLPPVDELDKSCALACFDGLLIDEDDDDDEDDEEDDGEEADKEEEEEEECFDFGFVDMASVASDTVTVTAGVTAVTADDACACCLDLGLRAPAACLFDNLIFTALAAPPADGDVVDDDPVPAAAAAAEGLSEE